IATLVNWAWAYLFGEPAGCLPAASHCRDPMVAPVDHELCPHWIPGASIPTAWCCSAERSIGRTSTGRYRGARSPIGPLNHLIVCAIAPLRGVGCFPNARANLL